MFSVECFLFPQLWCVFCVFQAFCVGQLCSALWSTEHHQQTAQEWEDAVLSQPGYNSSAPVSGQRWRFSGEFFFFHRWKPALCLLCMRHVRLPLLPVLHQKLTEQRVPVFSHEIVPDYLRTKPDPDVEEQEKQLSTEAARIGPELAQVSNRHWAVWCCLRHTQNIRPCNFYCFTSI